jgi:hypothetical protein
VSRSIQVTRRTLQELKRFDFADAEQRQARVKQVRESLRRKRAIKWRVRQEGTKRRMGIG